MSNHLCEGRFYTKLENIGKCTPIIVMALTMKSEMTKEFRHMKTSNVQIYSRVWPQTIQPNGTENVLRQLCLFFCLQTKSCQYLVVYDMHVCLVNYEEIQLWCINTLRKLIKSSILFFVIGNFHSHLVVPELTTSTFTPYLNMEDFENYAPSCYCQHYNVMQQQTQNVFMTK